MMILCLSQLLIVNITLYRSDSMYVVRYIITLPCRKKNSRSSIKKTVIFLWQFFVLRIVTTSIHLSDSPNQEHNKIRVWRGRTKGIIVLYRYNWNISSCCCWSFCSEVFTLLPCVMTTADGRFCMSPEDDGLGKSFSGNVEYPCEFEVPWVELCALLFTLRCTCLSLFSPMNLRGVNRRIEFNN